MTTRSALMPLFLALGLALAWPAGASAQCFTSIDDGFDQGCCGPVTPNVPNFPAILTTADYGALLGCQRPFVIPPFFLLRQQHEVYVEYDTGENEYYDLSKDPDQLDNRHSELAAPLRRRLTARLQQLKECAGAGCRVAAPAESTP